MDFISKFVNYTPLITTLVFASIIFISRLNTRSHKFLGFYMLFNFVQIATVFLNDFAPKDYRFISFCSTYGLILSTAPWLFFYIASLTDERFKLRYTALWHFAPALLFFILHCYLFLNLPEQDKQFIYSGKFKNVSDPLWMYYIKSLRYHQWTYYVQIFGYCLYFIYRIVVYRKKIKNTFSFSEGISLNWLLIYSIGLIVFSILELALSKQFPGKDPTLYFIVVNVYMIFLGILGIKQMDTFSNFQPESTSMLLPEIKPIKTEPIPNTENEERTNTKSYQLLNEEQKNILFRQLTALMETERLFLNPKLSIEDLAKKLQTNRNYISIVINDLGKENFFNFVNQYRIKEAIVHLESSTSAHLSIEGIAQSVGFTSRATFNPAFKKITGIVPSEYRKKSQSEKNNPEVPPQTSGYIQ